MIRRFGSSPKPSSRVRSYISRTFAAVDAQAVADAVVAGEVRRRLRRRDQVVARRARTRPSAGARTPPPRRRARGRARSCARPRSVTPGSIPSASFSSRGTPTRTPFRSSRLGDLDRLRQLDGRRVARVAAGDDPVEQRAVAHGLRRSGRPGRATTRTRRSRSARPCRRSGRSPTIAAERGRLLDRAAGVGAERPRREPGRDRRRRAARRAARERASGSHGLRVGP